MLDEKELESIYELLHSNVENNVNLALAIIEGREDVKRVFDKARRWVEFSLYDYMQAKNLSLDFYLIEKDGYKIIGLRQLKSTAFNKYDGGVHDELIIAANKYNRLKNLC